MRKVVTKNTYSLKMCMKTILVTLCLSVIVSKQKISEIEIPHSKYL